MNKQEKVDFEVKWNQDSKRCQIGASATVSDLRDLIKECMHMESVKLIGLRKRKAGKILDETPLSELVVKRPVHRLMVVGTASVQKEDLKELETTALELNQEESDYETILSRQLQKVRKEVEILQQENRRFSKLEVKGLNDRQKSTLLNEASLAGNDSLVQTVVGEVKEATLLHDAMRCAVRGGVIEMFFIIQERFLFIHERKRTLLPSTNSTLTPEAEIPWAILALEAATWGRLNFLQYLHQKILEEEAKREETFVLVPPASESGLEMEESRETRETRSPIRYALWRQEAQLLRSAAVHGHLPTLKFLVREFQLQPSDPAVVSSATEKGYCYSAMFLISSGAPLHPRLLELSVISGSLQLFNFLLSLPALKKKIADFSQLIQSSLLLALENDRQILADHILKTYHPIINQSQFQSCLTIAVQAGPVTRVQHLIQDIKPSVFLNLKAEDSVMSESLEEKNSVVTDEPLENAIGTSEEQTTLSETSISNLASGDDLEEEKIEEKKSKKAKSKKRTELSPVQLQQSTLVHTAAHYNQAEVLEYLLSLQYPIRVEIFTSSPEIQCLRKALRMREAREECAHAVTKVLGFASLSRFPEDVTRLVLAYTLGTEGRNLRKFNLERLQILSELEKGARARGEDMLFWEHEDLLDQLPGTSSSSFPRRERLGGAPGRDPTYYDPDQPF